MSESRYFATWSQVSVEGRLLTKLGVLSPLKFIFQRYGSQVLQNNQKGPAF